ncbi:hypothetical protein BURC_04882 [Burkholderiaceae bacterium]|nr:hypothetical protein BURC_04882 [Burkholderiaceae bacterium]
MAQLLRRCVPYLLWRAGAMTPTRGPGNADSELPAPAGSGGIA